MTEPGPNTNASKVLSAAAAVEDLVQDMKTGILIMRGNPRDIAEAYRILYEFRTRLGSQIAKLGFGKPSRRSNYPIDGTDAR